jgi:hypothetical protein
MVFTRTLGEHMIFINVDLMSIASSIVDGSLEVGGCDTAGTQDADEAAAYIIHH